jgi:hypothetical protein
MSAQHSRFLVATRVTRGGLTYGSVVGAHTAIDRGRHLMVPAVLGLNGRLVAGQALLLPLFHVAPAGQSLNTALDLVMIVLVSIVDFLFLQRRHVQLVLAVFHGSRALARRPLWNAVVAARNPVIEIHDRFIMTRPLIGNLLAALTLRLLHVAVHLVTAALVPAFSGDLTEMPHIRLALLAERCHALCITPGFLAFGRFTVAALRVEYILRASRDRKNQTYDDQ